uniref:transcriptional regulator ATRX isoform X2 n=1 Tax=Ciona intestinalis TaxID=7719 RepID=UPI000EF55443|nr:transcriptional regulator ATRX isoform X2 [Ciona intestinalis]|eukprot:XP_026695558.1 transcriptional regulator ATRX isoform X2 [Ciona intestinalis]
MVRNKPKPSKTCIESDEETSDVVPPESEDDQSSDGGNNKELSSSLEDSDDENHKDETPNTRKRISKRKKQEADNEDVNDGDMSVDEKSTSLKLVLRKRKASTPLDESSDPDDEDSSSDDSSAATSDEDQASQFVIYSQKSKRRKSRKNSRREAPKRKSRSKSGEKKTRKKKDKNTGRKKIKKIFGGDQLNEETKDAEKREEERRKRLEMRGDDKIVEVGLDDSFNIVETVTKRLVLQKEPLVEVHPSITVHLKPHQVEGVQFMWDNLIESTKLAEEGTGGGCILAHCMGLGKTLQTITTIHTILRSENLSIKTVLVVAPLNTLLNWMSEFDRWAPDDEPLITYNLGAYATRKERIKVLDKWKKTGGVMVLGYDMFRLLASGTRIRYKAWRESFASALLDPGPDIVVCDEGHKLKNSESNISQVMSKLKTRRRVVLTGTPLQNNLVEYQCMVNFVKPNLLGSLKEFRNRFVNPISNGQHLDSTDRDVRLMKKRSHVLHNMLQGFVQRKDYTSLAQYLCGKYEYIIKVRLSPVQVSLYRHYLDTMTNRGNNPHAVQQGSRDTGLFSDYQNLMRIWTHPRVLQLHTIRRDEQINRMICDSEEEEEAVSSGDEEWTADRRNKDKPTEKQEDEKKPPIQNGGMISLRESDADDDEVKSNVTRKSKRMKGSSDEEEHTATSSSEDEFKSDSEEEEEVEVKSRKKHRPKNSGRYRLRGGNSDSSDNDPVMQLNKSMESTEENEWYSSIVGKDVADDQNAGGKLAVLFEILRLAHECDDKILVFSQSLLSLDLIEEMLALSTVKVLSQLEDGKISTEIDYRKWYKNLDYFRMDGSSLGKSRQRWINEFNDETDRRARLFLISTKAGSLGVNLVAANRVVIFDASWNPSHDIQSIFRVYRFGQAKCCYIYRLIAQGTMEEKIYDRQVTKQSLSFRVVDEQQINRHFTAHDLQELYTFNPSPTPAESERPTHALPKDPLLAELLTGECTRDKIVSYHQHDSLLDHQEAEELTEEERKAAWEEYENEKKGLHRFNPPPQQQRTAFTVANQMTNQITPLNMLSQLQPDPISTIQQDNLLSEAVLSSLRLPLTPEMSKEQRNQAQSVVTLMLKATRVMQQAAARLEFLKPVDHEKTMSNLKALPMYRHMKDDSLRMIAIELMIRQQQQRSNAEKEFKTSKMQITWLESRYRKIIQDAVNLNGMIALAKAAANGPNSVINLTLDDDAEMKTKASDLARSSFQSLLTQNKEIAPRPAASKNGAKVTSTISALFSASSKPVKELSISEKEAPKSLKPTTIDLTDDNDKETRDTKPVVESLDTTKASAEVAKKAPPPKRVNENGRKKAAYESEEDSESDEDWETQYSRNAKNRSRRTRS